VNALRYVNFLIVSAILNFSLITMANAQQTKCVQPPSGIIAWWTFDETSGNTAQDTIGNNSGILINDSTFTTGLVGNAVAFDGIDDYIGAPDSDLWAFGSNDFTIEFWAKFNAVGSGSIGHPEYVFISTDEGSGGMNKWFFALGGGYLNFHVNGPSYGFFPLVPFEPIVGQWYHLALTKSGTIYTIYIDGVPSGTADFPGIIPNVNAPLTIGQSGEPFGGFMNGSLDEMSIYNRALSQSEISDIVNANGQGKCKILRIFSNPNLTLQKDQYVSRNLQAISGKPPFSWSIVDGNLSTGLNLSTDGVLSGTPTTIGTSSFTVKVTDADNNSATKAFTATISLAPAPYTIKLSKVGTTAVPGRDIDYFILVENIGPGDSEENLILEEDLFFPDFTTDTFSFISSNPNPDYVKDGLAIFWIRPPLLAGERDFLTYKVKLNPSTPVGSTVYGKVSGKRSISTLRSALKAAGGDCADWEDLEAEPFCTMYDACTLGKPPIFEVLCMDPIGAQCLGILVGIAKSCHLTPPTDTGPSSTDKQTVKGAHDPNEKLVVAKKFIQPDQVLVYPISFENTGNIEARDVFVTDVLDKNLDLSTLKFMGSRVGKTDLITRTVQWNLLNINLQPGASDNVLFSVAPLPNLSSGTEIRNKATVQFEVFEPMATNEVINVIDKTPPVCSINALPKETSTATFLISWTGSDAIGEIDSYLILVSEDGADFKPFVEQIKETSTTFTGVPGKTYQFICIATDTAGNVEIQNLVAEATTKIVNVQPPNLSALITSKTGTQNARVWTVTLSNSGPGPASQAQITGLTLTQTYGAACTPIITSPASFPLAVGDIAPQSSASGQITINFGGCASTARFSTTIPFSSNNGAFSGSKKLNNQFR